MAFTGVPVVKQVADGLVRITGVSLVDGASGTIGLFEKAAPAPDIRLPQGFKARAYSRPDGSDVDVSLQDCIEISFVYKNPPVTGYVPIGVNKAGTTPQDFLATLTSEAGAETNTNEIEIYVRYH